eukprot:gene9628-1832_t
MKEYQRVPSINKKDDKIEEVLLKIQQSKKVLEEFIKYQIKCYETIANVDKNRRDALLEEIEVYNKGLMSCTKKKTIEIHGVFEVAMKIFYLFNYEII